jgi:hypothetical protein
VSVLTFDADVDIMCLCDHWNYNLTHYLILLKNHVRLSLSKKPRFEILKEKKTLHGFKFIFFPFISASLYPSPNPRFQDLNSLPPWKKDQNFNFNLSHCSQNHPFLDHMVFNVQFCQQTWFCWIFVFEEDEGKNKLKNPN